MAMRTAFAGLIAAVMIGVVEGVPGLDALIDDLERSGRRRIVLKPFMIVAGDHAMNDMAGDDAQSWKRRLTAAGFEVLPVIEGLGSNDAFADLFVDHIADAARDAGIVLH